MAEKKGRKILPIPVRGMCVCVRQYITQINPCYSPKGLDTTRITPFLCRCNPPYFFSIPFGKNESPLTNMLPYRLCNGDLLNAMFSLFKAYIK